MTTIPDEIMEQAREVAVHIGSDSLREDANIIAQALLAAEKRGEERERERTSKVLIGIAALGNSIATCVDIIGGDDGENDRI